MKTIKVPKYVKELMERAEYEYDRFGKHEHYAVGYTIRIRKQTQYSWISTLKEEIERLKKWVERQEGGECHILYIPNKTHYCEQYAYVTIYDRVMQSIEIYMK